MANMSADFTSIRFTDTYDYIQHTNFLGKSVLITGASRGIGEAAALGYARAGISQIALAARSDLSAVRTSVLEAAKAAGHQPPNVLVLQLDITSLQSVQAALRDVESSFSSLDILVNNAGFMEKSLPIIEADPEEAWQSWEINYKGTYLMTKTFLPLIISSKGLGIVLNISSVSAIMPLPGMSTYSTTKFALLRLTEMIDIEYASQGIVAIALHPGGVKTELSLRLPDSFHKRKTYVSTRGSCCSRNRLTSSK